MATDSNSNNDGDDVIIMITELQLLFSIYFHITVLLYLFEFKSIMHVYANNDFT